MATCDPILYPFIETITLRFRTHRSGVWQNYKIWEVEDPFGSDIWRFAKYGEYPDETNPAYLSAGHTITMEKDQDCLDLNLNSDNDVIRFQTGTFKIIVTGTIRTFTGAAVGSDSSGIPSNNWFTGTMELVGSSREIIQGAWGNFAGAQDQFDLIVNAPSQILTCLVVMRVQNFKVVAGSYVSRTLKLSKKCIIESGAKLEIIVIEKTTTTAFDLLKIVGTLRLAKDFLPSANPLQVSAKVIQNNGLVEYVEDSESIGINNVDPASHPFDNFKDLSIIGSPITLTRPITVTGILKYVGTLARAGFLLNYHKGSTLEYAGTALQTVTLQEWDNKNCPKNVIFNNSNGVTIDDQRFLGEVGFPVQAETAKIKEGVVFIKPFEISPRIGTGNPASVWVDENNFAILDENDLVILTE